MHKTFTISIMINAMQSIILIQSPAWEMSPLSHISLFLSPWQMFREEVNLFNATSLQALEALELQGKVT